MDFFKDFAVLDEFYGHGGKKKWSLPWEGGTEIYTLLLHVHSLPYYQQHPQSSTFVIINEPGIDTP